MNPVRSRRRRSFRKRVGRKSARVFRNPHHLSAAHRRKISLAVKRRNRSGSRKVRSFVRRARKSTRRVIHRARRAVVRYKTRSVVKYRNRFMKVRRSSRRRSSRRSGSLMRGFSLRSILSKDNLTVAGGVVGSTVITSWVLQNYGAKLPGITNNWARVAYAVAIPVTGALLVKKISPKLAQGMVLGGIASGILQALSISGVSLPGVAVTGTSAYLGQNRSVRGMSGMIGGWKPSRSSAGYQGITAFSASPGGGVYDSAPAFRQAWTR